MSESKKKNLFDDSDGEEGDFKPQPAAEAQPAAETVTETATEATVAPVVEAP